ncbi:4'-phosphopantetheinyl transferase family protein [Francisella hispaniensis]|uniref:4-phosphopantetheinyl transferase n=1 Tax=Francisella hispaniensis FSC454 TaxID=1088883 RepID=A0AAC9J652_9GAMM|nr:4'-phosphopantetheinyl transferase superfamily protein [Francisella hispaniensis]APD51169.1 4-phosphopantetheinyl transferase [Francisella hispaniensis FSC454]KYW87495.1 4-phosphopantetheinyl transferase [Francisella hispaniensis FSC454]MBK2357086.1 4'-phosphopantetheinyl transferase superfamily protein [Francisella hispaniensis]
MPQVSAFILDFEKYKAEDLKDYLCCRNIDSARFNNKQKIFSQFIRYFVLEEFYHISSPIFLNQCGKPYLKDNAVFFNISHTQTKIIIAVGDQEIGVDIEKLSARRNIIRIAQRYFSELESHELAISNNLAKDFYALWTLKEAQVKRDSLGIAKGLSSADFSKINNLWLSNNYPRDFVTFSYDDSIFSICCKNIFAQKINLFEIVDFKFKQIQL